jgi:acetyl-CoA acetyltransferase
MDYRELIKKYIQHIGMVEGAVFIDTARIYAHKTGLTREEIAELEALEVEVLAEVKQGTR